MTKTLARVPFLMLVMVLSSCMRIQCLQGKSSSDLDESFPSCRAWLRKHDADEEVHKRVADYSYAHRQDRDALQHLTRALELVGKRDYLEQGELHHQRAQVFQSLRQYHDAEKDFLSALSIYQAHEELIASIDCLRSVGGLYFNYINDNERAEWAYRQALSIIEGFTKSASALPRIKLHLQILEELSRVLEDERHYSDLEWVYKQVFDIIDGVPEYDGGPMAASLYKLGTVSNELGYYAEAEQHLQRALKILGGRENSLFAHILYSLSLTYLNLGRFSEAAPGLLRAISVYKKLKRSHDDLAAAYNSLGDVYQNQGNLNDAMQMYIKALAVQQDTRVRASILNNIASILDNQGQHDAAEIKYRQVLAIRKRNFGLDDPDVATSLIDVARMDYRHGNYGNAEVALNDALRIREKDLRVSHPGNAEILLILAELYLAQGRVEKAVDYFGRIVALKESLLRTVATEDRTLSLLNLLNPLDRIIYGLSLTYPDRNDVKALTLRVALLHKGRALEVGAMANQALRTSSSREQARKLKDLRTSLVLHDKSSSATLRRLDKEIDQIMQSLAEKAGVNSSQRFPQPDDIIESISRRLSTDSALVDIELAHAIGKSQAEDHYVAILLFPGQRIVTVDLGDAIDVDHRIAEFLTAAQDPASDPLPPALNLYQRVVLPLMPYLAGVKHIYLSPDGRLNLIPFDALYDGTDYLIGSYHFHYLTSGRDLLRQSSRRRSTPALILANPEFGFPHQANVGVATSPTGIWSLLQGLPALPSTEKEASYLQGQIPGTTLLGKHALEKSLHDAHGPWFLLIATHAFFLEDVEAIAPAERGLAVKSFLQPKSSTRPESVLPGGGILLNTSALVLAGVEQGYRAASSAEDGILTADEARDLDLDGTQLVVLSACETGKGTTSIGQGVYGLRRGFLVAGAETLVTSLWRVHDEATGELMQGYYRKLLDRRHPGDRLGALQEAMQELRSRRDRSHPYYWAPFIVIGQDGPLRPPL